MRLFTSDLYRSFAFGFALGAVIVGVQVGPDLLGQVIPQAHAQTLDGQAR